MAKRYLIKSQVWRQAVKRDVPISVFALKPKAFAPGWDIVQVVIDQRGVERPDIWWAFSLGPERIFFRNYWLAFAFKCKLDQSRVEE